MEAAGFYEMFLSTKLHSYICNDPCSNSDCIIKTKHVIVL